ncbi:hypothetical protein ACEE21_14605 [Clostridium baratii]
MNTNKKGETIYLENGVIRDWSGQAFKKPTICVDGDVLVCWGEHDEVVDKYLSYVNKVREWGVDTSSMRILPLYKKLNMLDCFYVIEIANLYTNSGFIKNLTYRFNNDSLFVWLDLEKESKKVG